MPQVLTRLMGVITTDAPISEWFDVPMQDNCRIPLGRTPRLLREAPSRMDGREDKKESLVLLANMKQLALDLQESYTQVVEMISEGRESQGHRF